MKIRKASKIDNLYEKVKNYDLVLTVEAPLADALNNRLESPKLGEFATTPKRLAYGTNRNRQIADERQLFIDVVKKTDIAWKQAFFLLENVLNCWKNTGELRKILDYDQFNNPITHKIIEIVRETYNVYKAMEDFKPDRDKSTAVIAPYQFNELDKKVLPDRYDVVEVFEDGNRELPRFKVFGRVTDILQTIKENVSKENVKDVGIVVSPDSGYTPLLRSLFRSEGIPFMLGRNFNEDNDLRTILYILKCGLSKRRLRLRDVQPILRSLDVAVSVEHNREFLADLELKGLEELKNLLSEVEGSKFGEMIDRYEELTNAKAEKTQERFEEIGILEDPITEESVNRIEYYLDSFNIQMKRPEMGVLLASPKAVSFVDRPIVFYLGMDSKWEHKRRERLWIDQENFDEKNVKNFELLLQNGEQKYFLIRESKMGNKITPCLYFDEILDEEFDTFTDLPHEKYYGPTEEKEEAFEKEDYSIEVEPIKTISQSDLNKLVKCPREYFFSQVVPMENNEYLEMGSLFHDFAEFYVNNSEFVDKRGIEEFVELMSGEMKPFTDDFMLGILETRIRVGLENIIKFLKREGLERLELEDYDKKSWGNFFADHYDRSVDEDNTEAWFENPEFGGRGKVDLVKNETHLLDYKSGKRISSRSIVKNSNVELYEDKPNFQAILYLTHHRIFRPNEKLKFSFFYLLDNLEDVITGDGKLDKNIVNITYHPRYFADHIPKRETFKHLTEGVSKNNNRRKTLEKKGYSNYRKFFEEAELPHEYDKDKLTGSEFTQEYINYSQKIVGDYKYVEKGCESALRKLCDFRQRNYFKEDLDRFEEFLKDQLKNLNEYKKDRFPVGDAELDSLDNRDLILSGEYEAE